MARNNGICEIKCENEDLRRAAEALNKEFFGGKLIINRVGYFKEVSFEVVGQAQWGNKGPFNWYGVGINPAMKFAAKKFGFDLNHIILHELIHIWQYQNDKLDKDREGHGKWFNAKAMQIMEKNPKYNIKRFSTEDEAKLLRLLKKIRVQKTMGM